MPIFFVAILFPTGLGLDQSLIAVSLLLAGLLMSAVIGEPLRGFILEQGRLRPFAEKFAPTRACYHCSSNPEEGDR